MQLLRRESLSKAGKFFFSAALGGMLVLSGAHFVDAKHGPKAKKEKGEYLAGDFHQHTLYTDGSNPFSKVMEENANHGLDWWANSEHGGERNRDGNGNYWDDPTYYPTNPILGDEEFSGGHQEMWRWQSLRDYVFPDILTTRMLYPEKVVISGLEWNVPGHEHCSTGIVAEDASAISAFEFMFDASDDDTSREGEVTPYSTLTKQNDDHEDAVAAAAWMQAQKEAGLIDDGYIVFAHIERANSFTAADFRDFNNAGPDVCFGYEGAPGHQASGDRGFSRNADGGGTYGGSGWYSAEVGGLWDALLGEGRNWWNFASSDCHNHWTEGGSDFWPGEYQKNYAKIDAGAEYREASVVEGLRSGNSWHVEGDLIDQLHFTAKSGRNVVEMGETLTARPGRMVAIKIRVHDPDGANNCPFSFDNPSLAQINVFQPLNRPVLDHIDLIRGEVTGKISPDSPNYNSESNPATEVVATFERRGGADKNGYMTYVYNFKAEAGKNYYFRLRGTNLPANVPFETDELGNPVADSLANDNLYASMDPAMLEAQLPADYVISTNSKLDEVVEAYADLWFYSNPIFVEVTE